MDHQRNAGTDQPHVVIPINPEVRVSKTTWFDFRFFLSLFNFLEVIVPWTKRKTGIWSIYLMFAALFTFLEIQYDLSSQFVDTVLNSNELWLALFLYGYEPMLMFINLMFANYPDKFPWFNIDAAEPLANTQLSPSPIQRQLSAAQRFCNGSSAIVIPSHRNAAFIQETLKACLQIVHSADQIIVVDNGKSDAPLDDTLKMVKTLNSRIRYVWVNQPNKTIAQYVGIKIMLSKYNTALVIDDDVLLPADFVMPTFFLKPGVDGFCIPIRAVDSKGNRPLFIAWQDIEYKKSGFWNALADRSHSVAAPHGAIAFWRSQILCNILEHHNLVFYGEDSKIGLIAQHCNYNLRLYPYFPVNTVAPTSVFGTRPNWWAQRVRSWEMIRHARLFSFVRHFFSTSKDTLSATLMLKLSQFNMIHANIADLLRLPVMIVLGNRPGFWIKLAIFQTADLIFMHLWNEEKLRYRPKEKSSKFSIWTYWIYKQLLQLIAIPSFMRALFIYLPNAKTWKRIPELEESGGLNMEHILDYAKQLAQGQGFSAEPDAVGVPIRNRALQQPPPVSLGTREVLQLNQDDQLRDWRLDRFERDRQITPASFSAPSNETSVRSYPESQDTGIYHTKPIPSASAQEQVQHPQHAVHRSQVPPPQRIRRSQKTVWPPQRYSALVAQMSEYSDEDEQDRNVRAILHQKQAQIARLDAQRESRRQSISSTISSGSRQYRNSKL